MLLEIRIFRCELGLFYIFINAIRCCCAWVTWLWGCAMEASKEVDSRWLLERCLSTLGYVCSEFFHFANSKTSSSLPPSVSPKVALHKKASSQMVSVYFYYFFFNYCFVGPMLGGSLPCFFWGLRVLPACVCLPLPCGQRCESWSNFLLPTFHLASQIFACVAFEILVIVCGHWWVFESACVHLPPGVMMCRNVRSVTPLPDLSDSRALRDFTTISCNIMATIS